MELDESLLDQLTDDLQSLFDNDAYYNDMVVKKSYDGDEDITYPMVVVQEIENEDNDRYYDGQEHIVDVAYQFDIMAEQTSTLTAEKNVRTIMEIIKNYMRGERYHALRRVGGSPIISLNEDGNIKIGYMRYQGRIDIDNNIIYRRR